VIYAVNGMSAHHTKSMCWNILPQLEIKILKLRDRGRVTIIWHSKTKKYGWMQTQQMVLWTKLLLVQ